MRIHLNKRYSFLVVGYFLQLHDLVVVVDGLLIEWSVEEIDDVLVGVSEVEDPCDLQVEVLLVGLLTLDALIYDVDLVVSLLLDLGVPFGKGLLEFSVVVLYLLSSVLHLLDPLLDGPTADCPAVDLVCYLFLGEELQETFPLHVKLQAADNLIQG